MIAYECLPMTTRSDTPIGDLMMDSPRDAAVNALLMDRYRSVTMAKSARAQRMLDHAATLPQKNLLTSANVHHVLLVLGYVCHAFHVSSIILDIHDLWSETYFSRGYRYGIAHDRESKTHNLLKPYGRFTKEQKVFEDMLGMADLNSLYTLLCRRFPETSSTFPQSLQTLRMVVNKSCAVDVIGVLAQDDDFIMPVAHAINENWANTKSKLGYTTQDDSRLAKTVESLLCSDDRETLMNNARTDILSVALFIERML
ncbi:MAG TPA: RyR domain-containing protein [Ktedonobacteraceae bacterium]|nr:RyR domain-containing protein [Ktedonobacteraceae bacterium]